MIIMKKVEQKDLKGALRNKKIDTLLKAEEEQIKKRKSKRNKKIDSILKEE